MARGAAPSATTQPACWRTARRPGCSASAGCASRDTAYTGTGPGGANHRPGPGLRRDGPSLEDAAHLRADTVELPAMGFRQYLQGVLALLGKAQVGDTTVPLGAGTHDQAVGFEAVDEADGAIVPHA